MAWDRFEIIGGRFPVTDQGEITEEVTLGWMARLSPHSYGDFMVPFQIMDEMGWPDFWRCVGGCIKHGTNVLALLEAETQKAPSRPRLEALRGGEDSRLTPYRPRSTKASDEVQLDSAPHGQTSRKRPT